MLMPRSCAAVSARFLRSSHVALLPPSPLTERHHRLSTTNVVTFAIANAPIKLPTTIALVFSPFWI
jgi:hypothetical protein